jgi:hypothetical protein
MKRLITAMDVGPMNSGLCTRDIRETPPLHLFNGPMVVTKAGRVYRDVEEGIIPEICASFLHDHRPMYCNSEFFIIEKQMHDFKFKTNKTLSTTVLIENCLHSMLLANAKSGHGPFPIVKRPSWWREVTGVAGVVHRGMSDRAIYEAHKESSREAFRRRFGVQAYKDLAASFADGNCTDAIEAYWITEAVIKEYENIKKEACMLYSHNAYVMPIRIRIPVAERSGKLLLWTDPVPEIGTQFERVKQYHEYRSLDRDKKKKNTIKRELKKAGLDPVQQNLLKKIKS